MIERIIDMECPRCKGIYESTSRDTIAVLVNHVFLAICPKCTTEVADLMGYTSENITNILAHMKEADTERNKQRYIDEGYVCYKCHKKLGHNEPRVKVDDCSNTHAWHVNCYENI